ncbi:aminopeptidase [Nesidiocoris tenuis]|uniref:Aminopeptidase n=1 Tax=Nesidiocoris tenuis TaxID=355587 RepID=A0ABN7AYE5_9HEMI|nr:aminopeptidase [Nesidiocoris tenuis]
MPAAAEASMATAEGGLTKPRGYQVTRTCAFLLACLFLIVIASALLLMYLLAPCPCARSSGLAYSRLSKKSNLYVRLPTSVVPHSYDLKLIPFLQPGNFNFSGNVDITINVTQPTYNITLHSADLSIHTTSVRRLPPAEDNDIVSDASPSAEVQIPIRKTEFDLKREFYIMHFNQRLEPGQYKLVIQFAGVLNDALQGFYRSSYVSNNVTSWIATTQFQSTDARRAFPCFDEPALKAKFTIHIGRPEQMNTISNMPKSGPSTPVEGIRGYYWDHFSESLPMSTYLVAFTVSDFDHYADGMFKVWARSSAVDQAKYALSIGPRILRYFEQYFGIRYPLPKMDMIALPDFAAGAMENWGLITYRESTMLYQEGVSASRHKQRVGTVVAHELAHQWFGNLVTPSWWTDLWLNEGFATYIESLGVEVVEPTWRTGDQFVVHDLQNVLEQDAYKSSHPVSAPVSHPNEIDEIFDSISYGKGASIIRMMDHFLTTPVFKRGLTNYLNSRIYGSASQDDLWEALTDQAHADNALDPDVTVKQIMDTWTLKTGFPVVTVIRNYDTGSAEVTQKRFQYVNALNAQSTDWWVPLSYTTQDRADFTSTRPSYWLKARSSIVIDNINTNPNRWVIFNINETGFYRVNYDERNWQLIINQLRDRDRFMNIGELNRAQLIDDSLQLARAGLLNYSIALNLTTYLSEELAYLPWEAALPGLGFLNTMLKKMPIYDKFKGYFLNLINRLYEETGFIDKHTDEQLLIYKRVEVLRWACALGHEDCVKNAVLQFQHWRSSPNPDKNNPVSPNLKSTIYCTALREGGQAEWDFAWERYLNANVGSEKALILQALGCTRETWILSRYLHRAITEASGIRKQDTATVFDTVAGNIIGRPLAFEFVRDNWQKIKKFLGPTVFTLSNIIRFTTSDMITEYELKQLKEFAMTKGEQELGSATKAVDQSIEIVEANVHWMKNFYKDVELWLQSVKY